MPDSKTPNELEAQVTKAGEISEVELDQVTGDCGPTRKAGERPVEYLTSQSSGAGAAKITFNPL
jgi:hypothetical protein